MRNRLPALFLVGGVLLLVVTALLGRVLTPRALSRFPSSLSAGPEGLLALRRLLVELGIPVQLRTRPWDDLAGARPEGVLVLALPIQRPVDPPEADVLIGWVRRGGSLLVVDDATTAERDGRLDRILAEAGAEPLPPAPEFDEVTLMPARPGTKPAVGAPIVPAGKDLRRLDLHGEGGIRLGSTGIPLALSSNGVPVAAESVFGKGRVILVCGSVFANDRLEIGDNLTFALRLATHLRGEGPVLFDEYHHGYGGVLPALRGLDRRALGWVAVQASVTLLLYGLARGIRFGPPRLVSDDRRRSSLEFVRSLASLYRRAGARRHVIEEGLLRFEREVKGRFGLPTGLGLEALAGAVAERAGLDTERVLRPLLAASDALRERSLSEKEMTQRAGDLARLEEEVLGDGREAA
jgi:uncharacterized protein DUF4350